MVKEKEDAQLLGYTCTNKECFDLIDAHIRKENTSNLEAIAENF